MADFWDLLGAAVGGLFGQKPSKTVGEATGGKPKASPTPSWLTAGAGGYVNPAEEARTRPHVDGGFFSTANTGKAPDWMTGPKRVDVLDVAGGPEVEGGFFSSKNKGVDRDGEFGWLLGPERDESLPKLPGDPGYVSPEEQRRKRYHESVATFDQGLRQGATGQTRELSRDEYMALTPAQRAAVDANSALARARELDLAESGSAESGSAESDKDYQSRVDSIFGKDGGSALYAPRTLEVIEKLGLGGKTQDLDQYLNLSTLVSENDLAFLADGATVPNDNVRAKNAQQVSAAATKTLAQTLAKGQTILESMRGGKTGEKLWTSVTPAFADDERTAELEKAFTVMGDRTVGMTDDEVSQGIGYLESELGLNSQQIFEYFERRLRQLEVEGSSGKTPLPDFMTADEFRGRYYTGGK